MYQLYRASVLSSRAPGHSDLAHPLPQFPTEYNTDGNYGRFCKLWTTLERC